MPYILRHRATHQIFTCILKNSYGLEYYGVKFWEDAEEADEQYKAFLRGAGVQEPEEWEFTSLEELQLKLSNVKLRNNPVLQLYWKEAGMTELKSV